MTSPAARDDSSASFQHEPWFHEACDRFEAAWKAGGEPRIEAYLDEQFAAAEPSRRTALLSELILIDLEYRWQRAGERPSTSFATNEAIAADDSLQQSSLPSRPMLEDYAARYPQLVQLKNFPLELIKQEYRVRCLYGDRPSPTEYETRFSGRADVVRALHEPDAPPKPPPQALRLNCPHCHSPIEVLTDAEDEILCPSCGSTFRVDSQQTKTWSKDKLPKLGKFELLNRLGFGAFGTVYKAYDSELKRTVALKLPRSGTIVDQEDEDRFLREARSAAQLRHSGIVPIFEVGRSQHFLYIVSELVDGITLADALTAKRLSFRESAQLVEQVAEALDYSHRQGVVHRDLKPSNIMLSADGTPRLMDFGLAKRETGEITMTIEGQVLGTPAYMSPEQASGKAHEVDGRSDVYSLGVILFELLTGELPFRGNQRMLMHQVINDEPRSPRSLNDRIPRDLETICLKAMAKEPERRYGTAANFAADLKCYLVGQPILARPVGKIERAWRWCKRKPVSAALLAALMAGTGGTSWQAIRATLAEQATSRALEDVTAQKERADVNEAKAREQAARLMFEQGWSKFEQGDIGYAILLLARSLVNLESLDRADGANETATRAELSSLSHSVRAHLLELTLRSDCPRFLFAHDRSIVAVAFNTDGTKLATGSYDRTARLWKVATGEPLGDALQHKDKVTAVAFSADGTMLATGTGWDDSTIRGARGSENWTARLWDIFTGNPLGDVLKHQGDVRAVAFSPDGTKLATASEDMTVRLWDLASRNSLAVTLEHRGVTTLAFSPDGTKLATGSDDRTVRLSEVSRGKPLGDPLQHTGVVSAVAFSPDGMKLAAGTLNRTARIWEVATHKPLGGVLEHTGSVRALAFSADATKLSTWSSDGTARAWDAVTGTSLESIALSRKVSENAAAYSADGTKLVTASTTARLWDLATGKPVANVLQHRRAVVAVAFSPDGSKLATASADMTAHLWNVATGKPLPEPHQHTGSVFAVAFSPDGTKLATGTGSQDKTARLWDLATGKQLGAALEHTGPVIGVAFSPDGTKLATLAVDSKERTTTARLWEVATGKPLGDAIYGGDIRAVAFSPDGTKLAIGEITGVHFWDIDTGKTLGGALQHAGGVSALAFSPDGTELATGSFDQTARHWDVAKKEPLRDSFQHTDSVRAVAFSPDGKKIATGSQDKTARLWDLATGKQLGAALEHTGPVLAVAFSPDGAKLATASTDKTARLWDIPGKLVEPAQHVYLWVETLTGATVSDAGVTSKLNADEIRRRQDALREVGGPPRAWLEALDRRRQQLVRKSN